MTTDFVCTQIANLTSDGLRQYRYDAANRMDRVCIVRDGPLPAYALLGEYDNGSASGAGRTEYIYLPTQDGGALLMGMYRNGKLLAVHTDHLGTPRLITNENNKPVWQWPYSAFGTTKPTGVLTTTPPWSGGGAL